MEEYDNAVFSSTPGTTTFKGNDDHYDVNNSHKPFSHNINSSVKDRNEYKNENNDTFISESSATTTTTTTAQVLYEFNDNGYTNKYNQNNPAYSNVSENKLMQIGNRARSKSSFSDGSFHSETGSLTYSIATSSSSAFDDQTDYNIKNIGDKNDIDAVDVDGDIDNLNMNINTIDTHFNESNDVMNTDHQKDVRTVLDLSTLAITGSSSPHEQHSGSCCHSYHQNHDVVEDRSVVTYSGAESLVYSVDDSLQFSRSSTTYYTTRTENNIDSSSTSFLLGTDFVNPSTSRTKYGTVETKANSNQAPTINVSEDCEYTYNDNGEYDGHDDCRIKNINYKQQHQRSTTIISDNNNNNDDNSPITIDDSSFLLFTPAQPTDGFKRRSSATGIRRKRREAREHSSNCAKRLESLDEETINLEKSIVDNDELTTNTIKHNNLNSKEETIENSMTIENDPRVAIAKTTDTATAKSELETRNYTLTMMASSNDYVLDNNLPNTAASSKTTSSASATNSSSRSSEVHKLDTTSTNEGNSETQYENFSENIDNNGKNNSCHYDNIPSWMVCFPDVVLNFLRTTTRI